MAENWEGLQIHLLLASNSSKVGTAAEVKGKKMYFFGTRSKRWRMDKEFFFFTLGYPITGL